MVLCFGISVITSYSFADDNQVMNPKATRVEMAHEKATFNNDKKVYNDKTNKDFRAKKLADKNQKLDKLDIKKVQKEHDLKNALVEKNTINEVEPYHKQLTVNF